jgi:hypothetical protein
MCEDWQKTVTGQLRKAVSGTELGDSARVATPLGGGPEKNIDEAGGFVSGGVQGSQTKDIGMIMAPGQFGLILVVNKRGPDAGPFVGGHAHPDPCGADEDTKIGASIEEVFTNEPGIIWIIDGVCGEGSVVDDLMPLKGKKIQHGLPEGKGAVIASKANVHGSGI